MTTPNSTEETVDNEQRRQLNEQSDWGDTSKFTPRAPFTEGLAFGIGACLRCNVVVYFGDLALEKKSSGLFSREVEGIFCPNCNQMLFDPDTLDEYHRTGGQTESSGPRKPQAPGKSSSRRKKGSHA